MASLLLGIRNSVARKNVFMDVVKSSIRRTCSRSKTLIKRSNIYKFTFSSVLGFYLLSNNNSYCAPGDNEGSKGSNGSNGKDDEITLLIKRMTPMMSKIGFGGVMGFFAGAAVKRFGEEAAVAIGVCFIGLQTLSYFGFINIDYGKIKGEVEKKLDVTGDGKFDSSDLLAIWGEVKKVLTYNLPSCGGFSFCFALGLYYGR